MLEQQRTMPAEGRQTDLLAQDTRDERLPSVRESTVPARSAHGLEHSPHSSADTPPCLFSQAARLGLSAQRVSATGASW